MQNQDKTKRVKVVNFNQMIKEELYSSKYLKVALYTFCGVVGLFAVGFVLKAVNYTAHNFKNLSATLKR